MNELASQGNWPANIIDDVLRAIQDLQSQGYVENDFTLVVPHTLKQVLYRQYQSVVTYYTYLKAAGIVYDVIFSDTINDREAVVYATTRNMPFFIVIDGVEIIDSDTKSKITYITAV